MRPTALFLAFAVSAAGCRCSKETSQEASVIDAGAPPLAAAPEAGRPGHGDPCPLTSTFAGYDAWPRCPSDLGFSPDERVFGLNGKPCLIDTTSANGKVLSVMLEREDEDKLLSRRSNAPEAKELVTYHYDAHGKLERVQHEGGKAPYAMAMERDARGRLVHARTVPLHDGGVVDSSVLSWKYDAEGNPTSIEMVRRDVTLRETLRYENGLAVFSEVSQTEGGQTQVTSATTVERDAEGRRAKIVTTQPLAHETRVTVLSYDTTGRLISLREEREGGIVESKFEYDDHGDVRKKTGPGGTTTFTYGCTPRDKPSGPTP